MSSELMRKYSNIIKEGFAINRPSEEEEEVVDTNTEEVGDIDLPEKVDPKLKKKDAVKVK